MKENLSSKEISTLHDNFIMNTYAPNIAFVKGSGAKLWDTEGREFLDFTSGIAVTNLGHCHPNIIDAIHNQSKKLIHTSNLFYNELQPQLGKLLVKCSGFDYAKCFFCNSGAEANEGMIKLARLWGQKFKKYEIITMHKSFHGRTLATLTATGQDKVKIGFGPLPKGFIHAEFNNLDSVKKLINSNTVAIMVESIQGEGGVLPAEESFMQGLQSLCKEKGILLLCDEVQSGVGRTGKWFGFQHYHIEPDIVSLAKGLGSGFPIGGIIAKGELADIFQPGHHATTFGGTPLASAVALATINTISNEQLMDNVNFLSKILYKELNKIASIHHDWIDSVRGKGLMLGLVLKVPAKILQDALINKGLLTIATAGNILRIVPPLVISEDEVNQAIIYINEVCNELHDDMIIEVTKNN